MISTAGTLGRKAFFPARDAIAVARLRNAGAIVLGKTNCSDLTLSYETDNLVYGRTNNPYDLHCTSGESSGGVAAILAASGSPLDLGSDTGGAASACQVIFAVRPVSSQPQAECREQDIVIFLLRNMARL